MVPPAKEMYITAWGKDSKENSWYDFTRDYGYEEGYPPTRPNEVSKKSIAETTRRLSKLIRKEAKRYGGDTSRISVGGHSQGAMMAFHLLAHFRGRLGGYVGFLGHPSTATNLRKLKQPKGPVHFVLGMDDVVIPIKFAPKMIRKAEKLEKQIFLKKGINHDNAWDREPGWIRKWYKEARLFDKCPDLTGVGKAYLRSLPLSTLVHLAENLKLPDGLSKENLIREVLKIKRRIRCSD